jgi:hypothetical protein
MLWITRLLMMAVATGLALTGSSPVMAAPKTGLSGTVVAGESGERLAGVRVEVLRVTDPGEGGPLVATASTGPRGTYRLPQLPAGEYVVGFSKPGFVTENSGRENDPWQAMEIPVPGIYSGQLIRAARVSGTLAGCAGEPVDSAEVTITPAFHDSLAEIVHRTVTGGRFVIDGILPGRYTVSFTSQLTPRASAEPAVELRAGPNRLRETLAPCTHPVEALHRG